MTTTKDTREETVWEQLRKPFPKGAVGVLPKPYRKDSPKGKCNECGGYHGLPAVHLDYVGHANVTDRLNQVAGTDNWSWEPMATDDHGLPMLDRDGNLWIRLTVAGATKPGVGDGGNMKERIGDALRNAAMRFGVALDLWTKDELESQIDAPELRNEKPTTAAAAPQPELIGQAEAVQLMVLAKKMGFDTKDEATNYLNTVTGLTNWTMLPMRRLTAVVRTIQELVPDDAPTPDIALDDGEEGLQGESPFID